MEEISACTSTSCRLGMFSLKNGGWSLVLTRV
jgi:hypothetical protein